MSAGAYSDTLPVTQKVIHSFASSDKDPGALDGRPLCADFSSSHFFLTYGNGFTYAITNVEVYEYFLLASMACIALEHYEMALLHLEHVITAPAQTNAHVHMLEAYQKWVLLSCLVHGTCSLTFKTASASALKTMKGYAKPYESLVESFARAGSEKLIAEYEVGLERWDNVSIHASYGGLLVDSQ